MNYQFTVLKKAITISKIVTVHYFEYTKDYLYVGEKHNFWEVVYVDKGSIEIQRNHQWISLEQGEAVFHQPNEYHNIRANGQVAPNLVVIAFQCQSPSMEFFQQKILPLSDMEKHLLAGIVSEAKAAFSSPLHDPTLKKMKRAKNAFFGSEQMISIYLEQLLISLIRSFGKVPLNTTTFHQGMEKGVINDVVAYLQENIHEKLVFQQVLDKIGISASSLKSIFKKKIGMGVMTYFTKMKMEVAKTMIREGELNVTQIAGFLGYDSVHLFSRRFRQLTGMSPTEYGKSVKIEFEHTL